MRNCSHSDRCVPSHEITSIGMFRTKLPSELVSSIYTCLFKNRFVFQSNFFRKKILQTCTCVITQSSLSIAFFYFLLFFRSISNSVFQIFDVKSKNDREIEFRSKPSDISLDKTCRARDERDRA